MWEGFLHRPGTSCNTVTLGEQVIKLGMGSWLDLWEKNSMYDLRPASCPCNFPLYSEALANLREVFYWPGTHQPAVDQRASQKVCTIFGSRPAAIAGSVFSRPNSRMARVACVVSVHRLCTYTHTYIHTYMHTYIHTDIHAYINTYIHTEIHRPGYPKI